MAKRLPETASWNVTGVAGIVFNVLALDPIGPDYIFTAVVTGDNEMQNVV